MAPNPTTSPKRLPNEKLSDVKSDVKVVYIRRRRKPGMVRAPSQFPPHLLPRSRTDSLSACAAASRQVDGGRAESGASSSTHTHEMGCAQSSKWPRRQISPPDAAADEPMPGAPGAHCGARSGQLQRRPCSRIPSGRFCRLCSGPSRLSLQCNGIMLCTAVTNKIAHVSLYP